ncbi:RecB family exonuclease [Aeromicrobium halocynthiae]|uniref:RecB family exonuclease n=1 Tax=Aeromicrobium halocynthiae TaxID=560557 RepID=A0ABN2VQ77_9ACTN
MPVRERLSPSRAADFLGCPLRYRYRTVDRLHEPADPVAVRGTLVHAVLEDLFDLPAGDRTLERAIASVPASWDGLREEDDRLSTLFAAEDDERAWLDSAHRLLASYFALEDPRWLEPEGREVRVDHRLESGLGLGGIVDRIDVAEDGRIRIVDYKTGRSPGERHEDKALFQMRFYALVVWRSRGVLPTLLQLLYLGDRTVLSYEPTVADLEATERKLGALWQAIDRALSTGEFPARPGPLCRWCSFTDVCPERGGTALPWSSIRRVPADASLET